MGLAKILTFSVHQNMVLKYPTQNQSELSVLGPSMPPIEVQSRSRGT